MKRHVLKVALGLFLAVALAVPVFAIVNGEYDADNDHPNVCAIVAKRAPGSGDREIRQAISSATLIHPRVVLTAGHTVELIRNLVRNNDHIRLCHFCVDLTPDAHDGDGVDYTVVDTFLHPGFTGRDAQSIDVGLLLLATPVVGVTPVQLPDAGFLDDLDLDRGPSDAKPTFLVMGYGNTEAAPADGALPNGKRRVAVSTFKSLRTSYLMMSQNFALGEGGFSRGDSGGAAFWELSDGSLVQVGITVNGDHASASYGACVRTDLESVLSYIRAVIHDHAQ